VNYIFITRYSVKLIMPKMLRILCQYNLLITKNVIFSSNSVNKGKILLTGPFIYSLEATMKYTQTNKQKESYLQDNGVLNPHPERVQDELFLANEFFDPRDLLQVRYEMIRRHQIDKVSVLDTSKQFGVSRVTFYQITGLYDNLGIIGLVPQKPGPKSPTKCTEEIIEFVRQLRSLQPDITWEDLIHAVYEEFGITLHRRTIERRLTSVKKTSLTQGKTQTFRFSKAGRP